MNKEDEKNWYPAEEIVPAEVRSTVEALVKSRGRPEAVADERLLSDRDNLVGLLEKTWGEVGWNLRRVKTAADVRAALQAWEGEPMLPYPATILLRTSDQSATAKKLRTMISRKEELVQFLTGDAEQRRRNCRESLEKVKRLSAAQLTQDEQATVAERMTMRTAALEEAEAEYASVQKQIEDLDENIKDSHAHFARAEAVRFCKSGRYALSPFNTANALAGLPFIGYRQSIKRCRAWTRDDGFPYQVFLIVRRIFNSRRRGITLTQHAEAWLRAKHPADSYPIVELRRNWYYLQRSIMTALKSKPLPQAIPYRITTEYFRRTASPSNVDLVFEEDERIVVP